VTSLQLRSYVFDFAKPSVLLDEGPMVCPARSRLFVRLTVSPLEAPKVSQFSITDW